ncbi:MAG TPA: hypothetical protein VF756_25000 [Thermoanaerobaculia bacterium]
MEPRSLEPVLKRSMAGLALREGSPTIVAHLSEGCPTCAEGLRFFHRPGAASPTVLEQFERDFAIGLAGSGSPARALHSALAEIALRTGKRAG